MENEGCPGGENWVWLVPGVCPLARQILPYVVELHAELCRRRGFTGRGNYCLAGVEWYDDYMFVQAVLTLIMATSVGTSDRDWLEDSRLLEELRSVRCTPADDGMGRERCMKVMAGLADLIPSRGVPGTCPFARAAERLEVETSEVARMGEAVDECGVEMLKDIFYVATGVATREDRDSVERTATDGMTVAPGEVFRWAPDCPVMKGAECRAGECGHLTGLLPVIGVPDKRRARKEKK